MRGYWHFAAFSIVVSICTIIFQHYWFVIGLFLWLFYLFYKGRLGKIPLLTALAFFLFFSFYIPTIDHSTSPASTVSSQQQMFRGKIVRPLLIGPSKIDFIMKDDISHDKLLVIYFLSDDDPMIQKDTYKGLAYGAICNVTGQIDQPSVSRNPGQFDFNTYLKKQGISGQVIVGNLEDIQCEGSSFLNNIYSLRTHLLSHVVSSMSSETAAWLSALVFGDDSQLDVDTIELFQRWGLSHILAISGLHVGLIIGLIYFILVKLNIVTKETAQWMMIFFLPVYALIAGGQPSVWRATTMVLIFIIINKVKWKFSVTDVLSMIFILLIVLDKYIVYHVGFQLSFLVTLGLMLSKDLISRTHSPIYQGLLISFISQMMILPLQFTYFSLFQPLSIIANVIIVPYFSFFVIPLMFFMVLFSPFPHYFVSLFDTLFVNVQHLFMLFIKFVDEIASHPIVIGEFPVMAAMIYFFIFYLSMHHLQRLKLRNAFTYSILLVVLLISLVLRPYFSPVGTVTMLDIGQGDAFVIELPYRRGVILMDAGANFSFTDFKASDKVYKHIIKPYLYSKGITKVDVIMISHEDLDHMGSVDFLVDEMNVDHIIMSLFYELSNEQEALWAGQGVQITRVSAGDHVMFADQPFNILGPVVNENSPNENSLVVYTELGGLRWLFTGDIGKETERKIVANDKQLAVDVLKVAHHGSNTSTDPLFIQAINPAYALISAGVRNSYGHPTKEVLATLEMEGVHILRTDVDGAVQFKFKGNSGTFFKYLP